MKVYYNDNDPQVCEWLRMLMLHGQIPTGEVDDRSILDVQPSDLAGFDQCHFFAGIGGWAYALRLARWDRPCWTGSPPCQPFSTAGQGLSRDDPRHLAPKFISLVGACRPPVLFGEQVASADVFGKASGGAGKQVEEPAWAWLDDLSDRLEAARYAVGAADIPAAGVGAPHIRQRTFFVAVRLEHDQSIGWIERGAEPSERGSVGGCLPVRLADQHIDRCSQAGERLPSPRNDGAFGDCAAGRLADQHDTGLEGRGEPGSRCATERTAEAGGVVSGLADDECGQWREVGVCRLREVQGAERCGQTTEPARSSRDLRSNPPDSPWANPDWLFCRDGKWRPVESGTFPLAHGFPGRVGLLRGYGNAIVPEEAAAFVEACAEII